MRRLAAAASTLVAVISAAGPVSASPGQWAASLGAGTDGLGVDLHYTPQVHWVLRARASIAPDIRGAGEVNDGGAVDLDNFHIKGKTKVHGFSGFAEYHPWTVGSGIRAPLFASVGIFAGDRDVKLSGVYDGKPTFIYPIVDGVAVKVASGAKEIGPLVGRGKITSPAPVFGLGWDDTFITSRRWGLQLFGGVAVRDTHVMLAQAGGPGVISDAHLVTTITNVGVQTNRSNDFKLLQTYPLVTLSVSYRFGSAPK